MALGLDLAGWGAGVANGVPGVDDFLVRVCAGDIPVLDNRSCVTCWAAKRLAFDSLRTGGGGCLAVLLNPPTWHSVSRLTCETGGIIPRTRPIAIASLRKNMASPQA